MISARIQRAFLLLSLLAIITLTDSRYLKYGKVNNELPSDRSRSIPVEEEDVDLEVLLDDYYDELLRQFELVVFGPEKSKKMEKPKWEDYDYMSDMAAPDLEAEGKKLKGTGRDIVVVERKNFTWPLINGSGFNGSSEDSKFHEILRANRESNSQEEIPLRIKEMRVKSIFDQILKFRGGSSRSNESVPNPKQYNVLRQIYEKNVNRVRNEEWKPSYNEKVQSFYPSCDIPRNTDEEVWSDPYAMNLLFDLEYPSPQEDSQIVIARAKLRLYKVPQVNYSSSNAEENAGEAKSEKVQNNLGVLPGDDDRQIRVSVYWYTRSLKRNRVKKKLLDSQMLSFYASKWAEFNIRPAVRAWKTFGRNFGLVVNVEDEDGVLLPVEQYIHSMNCSKWTATLRPIPSILMDPINEYFIENGGNKNETAEERKDKTKVLGFQPFLFPVIDLSTTEVPNSDVNYIASVNSAKKALESEIYNLSRKGYHGNDSLFHFLKKNNLELKDISRLSRGEKSASRRSEAKSGESRTSHFINVPIGYPTSNHSRSVSTTVKRSREVQESHEAKPKAESANV